MPPGGFGGALTAGGRGLPAGGVCRWGVGGLPAGVGGLPAGGGLCKPGGVETLRRERPPLGRQASSGGALPGHLCLPGSSSYLAIL